MDSIEETEQAIERLAEAQLPTEFGDFQTILYHESATDKNHIALIAGAIAEVPLVRLHSECLTGDAFGSARCDCGPQLREAQRLVSAETGLILYLRQEGRGIGLANKIKAYALQDQGLDTVEANHELGFSADLRNYNIAAQMLHDLGITQVRLLTNNPAKIAGLENYGIQVVERRALVIPSNPNNDHYLTTKREKMNHLI